jgi:hypothetical protein
MRTFQDMLDCTSDAELGRVVRDRFTRMTDAAARRIEGAQHPSAQWNADNKTLRDHARAARDAAGSGLGARELEERDQPRPQTATDDPTPHTPGTPPNPQRPGASLAAHDTAVRAAIPGYDRILAQNRDKRIVDEDGIVVSAPRGW